MNFRIAPDWLMQLKDNNVVNSAKVIEIYMFPSSDSITGLINRGAVPYPDRSVKHGKTVRHYWSVGYLKNHLKLPTEINQLFVREN